MSPGHNAPRGIDLTFPLMSTEVSFAFFLLGFFLTGADLMASKRSSEADFRGTLGDWSSGWGSSGTKSAGASRVSCGEGVWAEGED